MAELATVAAVATAAAGVVSAGASIYSGWQANEAAKEQAHQLEIQGTEELAAAQRDAIERRLEARLTLSKQQAAAAASGGGAGADAPTIVRLMTETAQRADYGVQSTLFGGYSRRSTYFQSAKNARTTGGNNFIGSLLEGAGELLGGGAKAASYLR